MTHADNLTRIRRARDHLVFHSLTLDVVEEGLIAHAPLDYAMTLVCSTCYQPYYTEAVPVPFPCQDYARYLRLLDRFDGGGK